jgi:two-component sensor histidine kinase
MASQRLPVRDDDLLLQEVIHRCGNDLQLVVSLLGIQSRRATNDETRRALNDTMERVAVLARARAALYHDQTSSLRDALRQVGEALRVHAEPRGIGISVEVEQEGLGLPPKHVTTLALVVNELATNAIKHAFEEGEAGRIQVTIGTRSDGDLFVTVDDDGLPIPEEMRAGGNGLGMELAKRMMASIGGLFIPPKPGSKVFELRVPLKSV